MISLFRVIGFLIFAGISALHAQTLHYQGVARNATGAPLANTSIAIRLSIKDAQENGNTLYTETKSVITNGFGLYSISINDGNGSRTGNFATIDWSQQRFIQTETDPENGSAFTDLGTTPLHSVPQAFNALEAATLKGIPQPKEGYSVEYKNGEWIQKPKPKKYHTYGGGQNPTNTLNFVGPTITIPIEEDNPIITIYVTKAFGSDNTDGGIGLNVNLGYRKNTPGETIQLLKDPIGITNLRIPQFTRMPVTLSGSVVSDFKKGEFYVLGMLAYSLNHASSWNDNGSGMIVVEVSY